MIEQIHMKEFMVPNKIENSKEGSHERAEYLRIMEEYFHGSKKFDDMVEEIEKMVKMSVSDEKNIMSNINEPVIFISNHPKLDLSLSIPAEKIQNVKGVNAFDFDRFNYPLIRQLMLRKLLKRPFVTVSLDNGWREAMDECWHIIITRGSMNRFDEIMRQYTPGNSLVIFPEGRSTGEADVFPFKSGFFHLAQALNFNKIVLGVSSPVFSLHENNSIDIIDSLDVPSSCENYREFISNVQEKIYTELIKIHK
jgi:hypothetical protein